MLNAISELIAAYFQSLTAYIFIKKIIPTNLDNIKLKDFFMISFLAIIISIIHNTQYSTLNPLIIFFVLIFGQFFVYKINLTKSILSAAIFIISLFFADLMATIIFAGISTIEDVRETHIYVLLANAVVGIITVSLISIKKSRLKIIELLEKLEKRVV